MHNISSKLDSSGDLEDNPNLDDENSGEKSFNSNFLIYITFFALF